MCLDAILIIYHHNCKGLNKMEDNKKKITIYDIARISGFSPKTVSRVVNREENVKKSTYEKIDGLLKKYNYVPNTYARTLTSKTNKNILISVKKSESFPLRWFHILLEKIIIDCRQYDLNVIVEYYETSEEFDKSILHSSSSFIDVAIIFYESKEDERVAFLKKMEIPFIVFGKSNTSGVSFVTNNDYEALYSLMKYLFSRDIKDTVLLIGEESLVNLERVRGAKYAYKECGLDESHIQIVYQMKTIDDVYQFSKTHFTKDNLPDAIFVSGDEKVIGLIRAFHEKNIRIPEDVSIVGFDNIPLSAYFVPSLTTIGQNYTALSTEIVERVQKLITGNNPITSVEIPTKLIIRETTK